jgi:CRISPR system Cascade subunit CasE
MHAKKLLKDELQKTEAREPDAEEKWQVMQDAARQWLTKREEHIGATIDTHHLIINNYQQEQVASESKNNLIRYSTIDFQGVLNVTDSEKFQAVLFKGIGKAKAFGCGLMLVKRA